MAILKRFVRNWFTSASLLNLADEFATYKHKILGVKDKANQESLFQTLNGLSDDLKKAIKEEETQKGWKIFKEIRRTFIHTLNAEELRAKAYAILREIESKTPADSWRLKAVKEILHVDANNIIIETELSATQVIKAAEILDEHQDNFYEKLETLRRRIRTLSWITFVSLFAWVLIGPKISEFPLQAELSKVEQAEQYAALKKGLDTLLVQSTPKPCPDTFKHKQTIDSLVKVVTELKKQQSSKTRQGSVTTDTIQTQTDVCACNHQKCADTGCPLICNIQKRPSWLALLVILTGIIGAVVSGFIRTIQSGADGNVPDAIFGSTVLAARLMLASVAALSVYIFLGTGVILVFNAKISFELLLAFSFAAGFSEQLVQKGVEALSKQDLYRKKAESGK